MKFLRTDGEWHEPPMRCWVFFSNVTEETNTVLGASDSPTCSAYRDHKGNEFAFNDVVEGWSTRRIGRLVQVRKGCGQFGSDVYFLRTADGKLCTVENDSLKHSDAMITICCDTPETEYTITGEWPETGFIVDSPKQPENPGSFSILISSPNVNK
jgi:hypothetical protein